MKSPFSIKTKLTLDQLNSKNVSGANILNQLEQWLDEYGMTKQRINDHETFYVNVSSFRRRANRISLRDLKIYIEKDNSRIVINLETEANLVVFMGMLPIFMYPVNAWNGSFAITGTASCIVWVFGCSLKLYTLTRIKKDLMEKVKRLGFSNE